MLIGSLPLRGLPIVDSEGSPTDTFSDFLRDIRESNNNDNPLNNFRADAVPLVTNNRDEGYTTGSRWIYLDIVYTLTSFSGTDATWTALN